ncbi:MAG: ATP-dependent zinc metalloprotease FtsH [Tissierellia bacterium]|nr:ATP-dependent zinc metalloprotease FtsH [Tissierellia bacterium]
MNRRFQSISVYILIILLVYMGVRWLGADVAKTETLSIAQFIEYLDKDEVKSVVSKDQDNLIKGVLKDGTAYETRISDAMKQSFYADYIKDKVESGNLEYRAEAVQRSILFEMLPTLSIFVILGLFWYFVLRQTQGGGRGAMQFGKSRAKLHKEGDRKPVTFADVAGLEEEKEELAEIVEFLKNPRKFVEIGARIPTGVLLVGPPGTGKTFLSRAVAGEAKVPFFTISGSDFVEMFVGVGASRVRDLFEQGKRSAPCIIFIDEIDAVGRRRGAGLGGGHDEREQTLNQLLVEMDGFGVNEGVIVMAATNRADILDPALLRPGRFDRTVYVGRPDVRGREAVLKVHTRNKPLDSDVNLKVIAKRTPGFTPADLENLVNEAAILAARHNRNKINMSDVEEASIKVQAGPAKKSKVVTDKERKLTAVHEAGHALVTRLTPDSDPVHMITIIPRGQAGGFTAFIPEDDVNFMTKKQLEGELVSLLGGRVAEELVLEDVSTGAGNDIERATNMARAMVTHFGMSKLLGPINYGSDDETVFMGRDFGKTRNYSEVVAAEIDREMQRIISEAYQKATTLIAENLDILLRISDALLERETLSGDEFEIIFNGGELPPVSETVEEVDETLEIREEDLSATAREILTDEEIEDKIIRTLRKLQRRNSNESHDDKVTEESETDDKNDLI